MTTTSDFCPPQPDPATPQDRRQLVGCAPTALDHLKFRPQLLTGLLRDLLVAHFARAATIQDPALRSFVWRDAPGTGIVVESVHRWRPETADARPAILLKRNAYQNMRLVVNDRYAADKVGNEHFVTAWIGSHTLFCLAATGAAAEVLGTEVQQELTQFGPAVREAVRLLKYQVTDVSEVSEVKEATSHYAVAVTVGWAYEERWQLRREALPLAGFSLTLRPENL